MFDVVIVGGGPAGLSAALVLGRCRRRVMLIDAGHPRNASAEALHGFLTRDGTPPRELLRLGREDLAPYGIESRRAEVTGIERLADGFDVALAGGGRVQGRTTLIASGVQDNLPPIPGIRESFGITVHHCPYCDGWEVRDKRLAVIGRASSATALGLALRTWSAGIAVCTHGSRVRPDQRRQLGEHAIALYESRIAAVEHDAGRVSCVVTAAGDRIPCDAIFLTAGQTPHSELARRLGCEITRRGLVKTDHLGQTCVPGVYVAGDASRDVQFAIVAAAEGAKAAVAINKALQADAGLTVAT